MKYCKIKKEKDFKKLFVKGKKAYAQTLSVVYMKGSFNSMGLCVGKKYGKAVKRNRIKRLLRAAFYPECDKLDGYFILLIPKQADDYSFKNFSRDLKYIFKREKLYGDKR